MASQYLKPYTCILQNLPVEYDDEGKPIGSSYRSLKDILAGFGFSVDWVEPAWTKIGFHGYVLIQFGSSPEAFKAAYRLEKLFQRKGQGRDSWFSEADKGKKPYLWVARKEDRHFFYKVQKKAKGGMFVKPFTIPEDWVEDEGDAVDNGVVEALKNNIYTVAP